MRNLINLVENAEAYAVAYIVKAMAALEHISDHVHVTLEPNWDDPEYVELENIYSKTHRRGWGTKAMHIICNLATELRVTLTLGVANEGDGTSADDPSEDTLIAWYDGFGFEIVQGMTDRVMMKRRP